MKSFKHIFKTKISYFNLFGELHREDGPAIIWKDGTQEWKLNGIAHRLDGPSFNSYKCNYKCWNIFGNALNQEAFNNWNERIKLCYWCLKGCVSK